MMSSVRAALRCSILLLCTAAACSEVAMGPNGGGSAVGTQIVITPGQIRLAAVGDTARLRASLYDGDGNLLSGTAVTWTSADPAVFTIDQSGLVTGKQAQSVGRAIASASGHHDTADVVVANPTASPCLGYAAPVALAVGQAVSVSMSDGACITSAGGGDEYIVMPWFGTSDDASTMPLEVTGIGLGALHRRGLRTDRDRIRHACRPRGRRGLRYAHGHRRERQGDHLLHPRRERADGAR